MKLFIVGGLILSTLILFNFQKSITGTGPVETQTYNISEFSSFDISGDLKVSLNIGDEYLVQVTTNENIFDYLDISVKNNVLIYELKPDINIKDTSIHMHVVCPKISNIDLAARAEMSILDPIECSELSINMSSLSNLLASNFTIDNSATIKMSSGSKMSISDIFKCSDLYIDIGSSANLSSANLKVDNNTNIELSSSADMNISDMFECSHLDIDMNSSANLSVANFKVDNNTDIELSSSTNMNISDTFECSSLDIDMHSKAKLTANNVNVKACEIKGTSSSELHLVGDTPKLYLDLSSSATALLSNFIVENAEVKLSSSAQTEINATNNIYLDGSSGSEITIYNGNLILADKYNGATINRK
ncbi:MAG: hypothetical protein ATN31_11380 [Candidatus Epulonipiscioides saccharophilum]|nr:MAG: hypothetical protein ATN31_11380 [Epulopiscium sp. AS2M-Bin001]